VRVTKDEEDEEDDQHQLQQALCQQRGGSQGQPARRIDELAQEVVHLLAAGSISSCQ
jgi:hypothetical protein